MHALLKGDSSECVIFKHLSIILYLQKLKGVYI